VKRSLTALVLMATTTGCLGLSACASSSQLSEPAGSSSSGGDSIDKVLADAPTASSIQSGTLMAKVKQAGVLKVGGTAVACSTTRCPPGCEQVIREVCADFAAEPAEFNGAPDHVHPLVHHPPTSARSRLVNSLKGVSSRRPRQEYLGQINRARTAGHM
jgi:hypothetical protein